MLEAAQVARGLHDVLRHAVDRRLHRRLAHVLGVRQAEDRLGGGGHVGRPDQVAELGGVCELGLDLVAVELAGGGVCVVVEAQRRQEGCRRHGRRRREHLGDDLLQRRGRVAAHDLSRDRHVDPPAEPRAHLGGPLQLEIEAHARLRADNRALVAAEALVVGALGRQRHSVGEAGGARHPEGDQERGLPHELLPHPSPALEEDLADPHWAQVALGTFPAPRRADVHDRAHHLGQRAVPDGDRVAVPALLGVERPVDRGEVGVVDVLDADL